jgi:fibronectin type 3 domain-containing protein
VQEKDAPKPKISAQQALEFSGADEGRVLDKDAVLDHIYTYTVQRVEKITMRGELVAVAGPASKPMRIDARDLFPPATPTGLQAVADPEARAIDLSWQPDTEADLAGYRVYRREAGASAQPARVSGAVEAAPSFRDAGAQPGHTYWYSVSAVDKDGNESPRSAEVEESLPQQ